MAWPCTQGRAGCGGEKRGKTNLKIKSEDGVE